MGKLPGAPPGNLWFYGCTGELGELSNHFQVDLEIDGKTYSTTENYFQSMKFLGSEKDMEELRLAATPKEASKFGRDRSRPMRKDWDAVMEDGSITKEAVMKKALQEKFTKHSGAREVLLATGDLVLVEHTDRDNYWGDGGQTEPAWAADAESSNGGKNKLGLMLMELRASLRV